MPFLRISRDRRGYEYFCLVHAFSNRRGKVRPRTLYWFRSPPSLKVGRAPFDDHVMRALEAQHPDLVFDWDALRRTPMPPPSVEHWRERRRAEKAMRQFRAADEAEGSDRESAEPAAAVPAPTLSAVSPEPEIEPGEAPGEAEGEEPRQTAAPASPVIATTSGPDRRRRRRRRGRRGWPGQAIGPPRQGPVPTAESVSSSTDQGLDGPADGEPGPETEDR